MKFIEETNLRSKLTHVKYKVDLSHPLYGKRILMTGFRDKALETAIKAKGGKMTKSVSQNIFVVLVPTMDSDTGKAEEAREKKLTLMIPAAFTKKYL